MYVKGIISQIRINLLEALKDFFINFSNHFSTVKLENLWKKIKVIFFCLTNGIKHYG